ncbi:Cell adhesion molecule 3 [Holothuria leucospilota]|uniref:Cell adhesion molecule 3 n=1 Tax=Holothuria leucospilota TaxID=206669 RepID=A0A9Q1BYF4_HOLLE|nr:Cell adhesion molecule 3 [Holothuria leucospilota]
MGWYLIFVTCFFSFPIARTTILVGPKSAVYPEGSNVTLQCLAERTNRIVWEDVNDNTVIFIDKEKNTEKVKFDNFVISNGEDNFSLTIVNAELSDEGFYACEEGDESRSANVTIEAGPDLSIHVLVPENRTITEDERVFVLCKAEGAKPAVRLKLKFGDNEWIESNNTITNEGLHFTTETRVAHRVTRADTTVTCQATGQVSIPPSTTMSSMNVLHKPACVIELGTDLAECQCVSNPAVSTYSWYVNGELQSTDPSLRIHEYIPANITCLASNEVGISPLTSRYVSLTDLQSDASTKDVVIIISVIAAVIVCAIVIGVILIIVYKQSKRESTFLERL